jgi:hypothetical protein
VLTASVARLLLVVHTALAVAAIGASTHVVLWLRKRAQIRTIRKLAYWSLGLHAAAFLAGNVMYPTYKVEVRSAYLESPDLVNQQVAADQALDRVLAREGHAPLEPEAELPRRAAKAARWFDVKEHWVALGLLGSCALVLMLALWGPKRDGEVARPVVLGLATVVCATLWLAGVIGVVVASWRAV